MIDFATKSKINGGLSLIFPHEEHDLMKLAVNEMAKPKSANVFSKLLLDRRHRERHEPSAPKGGFAMHSFNKFNNPGF